MAATMSSLQGRCSAKVTRSTAARPLPLSRAALKCCAYKISNGEGLTYKAAGVDIDAGDELVKRIQKMNPNIGGFSGFVPLGDHYLVAGTDGVGTKLKLAFDMNKHDTVGIDLVAMSVNDVVTSGAKPLFFLDYFATGKLDVDQAENVIKGIKAGCDGSGCILLGGETAEMPGFYQAGEYDLAGFAVGAVKKNELIDGKTIKAGDVVVAFKSSGVHSNGFSLVRKVLEVSGTSLHQKTPWSNATFGSVLLEPTVLYVLKVLELHAKVGLKGVVHITGGGMTENIPRVIPKGLGVRINSKSYELPPLFQWLQETGKVPLDDMRRTFNLGVGMVVVVDKANADKVQEIYGKDSWVVGEVITGDGVSYI